MADIQESLIEQSPLDHLVYLKIKPHQQKCPNELQQFDVNELEKLFDDKEADPRNAEYVLLLVHTNLSEGVQLNNNHTKFEIDAQFAADLRQKIRGSKRKRNTSCQNILTKVFLLFYKNDRLTILLRWRQHNISVLHRTVVTLHHDRARRRFVAVHCTASDTRNVLLDDDFLAI